MDSDSFLSDFVDYFEALSLTSYDIVFILLIFLCLFVSAFASAAEMAFLTCAHKVLPDTDLRDKNCSGTSIYAQSMLATILVLNCFANISAIIFSVWLVNDLVGSDTTLTYIVQLLVLPPVILLIGEIMPKLYARRNSESVLRRSTFLLRFFELIFRPITKIMVRSALFVDEYQCTDNSLSMEDLSQAVEITQVEAVDEKEMLQDIVKFGDKTAQEVMTARADLTDVDIHTDFETLLRLVVETGYSRIPVYDETPDNIKGIIYIKDLLPYLSRGRDFEWRELLRPAYFVPETKRINQLLEEFRRQKIHMAVVVDEFGGTSGIVTLEDVLEEIVGEISDEYDEEEQRLYAKINNTHYLFLGKTPVDDFYEIMGVSSNEFNITDEPDTLAGLILSLTEDFPQTGDVIRSGRFCFAVLEMDKYRIERVKVSIDK